MLLSVSEKNFGKLQKMGPTNRIPASSHIYTSYGSSTDQIIERMTNLAFTNDLKFEKPKMV